MSALTNTLTTLVERFKLWREHQRAFAELNALDDHALADLGLRRADIAFVVYRQEYEANGVAVPKLANRNDGLRAA
jgi:uncharacterized protein YjiS (DUF1127 family)